ncbi:RND family efflux transporter, MFP subunit [Rivularia sp. PCC 7116]|uniref:efflux RND transporter periplasmic adaptor subunit n=1 Tax=Rivularia sp. PCC 7116 TaxID=373994 RepID=UPI00029F451F|nr:efflux RND transporter periplasmic adaptor subunit [Rivularia sp. PCC 7116]AFY58006.1 RND family efflux transporter, MFP subunit [Rivularia sp. PCC 7116]
MSNLSISAPNVIKKLKNSLFIKLIIYFLLIGTGLTTFRFFVLIPAREARTQLPTQSPERQDLKITITANGKIEPERSINISPKNAGVIKSLLVEEGDTAKKGQIIAYMDDSNLQGQLTQAKAGVASAQASLEKLKAGNRPQEIAQVKAQLEEAQANLSKLIAGNRPQEIAQAEARLNRAQVTLNQTEAELNRYQQLFNSGAISRQNLSTYQTNRETALTQVKEAEQALNLLKIGSRQEDIQQARAKVKQLQESYNLIQAGTRTEDVNQALAQVNSARGSLQTILAQIDDTVIRAPFDGVITKIYSKPGSFVTPNTAGGVSSSSLNSSILSLTANNQLVANIAESNLAKISIEQKVNIKTDAYLSEVFIGKVSQIAAQATVEQNVTSFEVTAEIISSKKKLLRSGMNVETEFEIGEKQNALVVPTVAVVRKAEGTGVYILNDDNKPVFKSIQTGVVVKNQTEVKSGLTGKEKVVLSAPDKSKSQPRGLLPSRNN